MTQEQRELLAKLEAAEAKRKNYRRNHNLKAGDVIRIHCEHPGCNVLRYVSEMVRTASGDLICETCATEADGNLETLKIERKSVRRERVHVQLNY